MIDKDILNFDPLSCSEKITGKSYKEDKDTEKLGVYFHLVHNSNKKQMLMQNLDTYWAMPYENYISVVKDLGFKKLDEWYHDKEIMTHWYHDAGLYLVTETHTWEDSNTPNLNTAHLYFSWISNEHHDNYGIRPSGSYFKVEGKYGFQGDIDVREGLRFNVETLLSNGTLVPYNEPATFVNVISHVERNLEHEEYMKLKREKMSRLPKEIKKVLNIL